MCSPRRQVWVCSPSNSGHLTLLGNAQYRDFIAEARLTHTTSVRSLDTSLHFMDKEMGQTHHSKQECGNRALAQRPLSQQGPGVSVCKEEAAGLGHSALLLKRQCVTVVKHRCLPSRIQRGWVLSPPFTYCVTLGRS